MGRARELITYPLALHPFILGDGVTTLSARKTQVAGMVQPAIVIEIRRSYPSMHEGLKVRSVDKIRYVVLVDVVSSVISSK